MHLKHIINKQFSGKVLGKFVSLGSNELKMIKNKVNTNNFNLHNPHFKKRAFKMPKEMLVKYVKVVEASPLVKLKVKAIPHREKSQYYHNNLVW